MADTFKNYINGKWVRLRSAKTFENRNPANRNDLIGRFPASGTRTEAGRDPLPGGRAPGQA
jgi:aldehyde dehydrogenase (NAD+)